MITKSEIIDEKFIDAYQGSNMIPKVLIEYLDDNGDWQKLPDVLNFSFSKRSNDNRKNVYALLPPLATISLNASNKDEQYTTGAGGTYDGVLNVGRKIRAYATYIVGD